MYWHFLSVPTGSFRKLEKVHESSRCIGEKVAVWLGSYGEIPGQELWETITRTARQMGPDRTEIDDILVAQKRLSSSAVAANWQGNKFKPRTRRTRAEPCVMAKVHDGWGCGWRWNRRLTFGICNGLYSARLMCLPGNKSQKQLEIYIKNTSNNLQLRLACNLNLWLLLFVVLLAFFFFFI